MRTENREILLCNICGGLGTVMERVTMNDSEPRSCKWCLGTGRVVKVTTTDVFAFGKQP